MVAVPAFPVKNSTDWYDWATAVDSAARLAGTAAYINAYDNGINNNSAADQSSALAAMYAAAPANSVIYFGRTVQPIIGLHAPGKTIKILGAGVSATEFRAPAAPGTNAIIFNFAANPNCVIEHLYVNGNNNASVARGISGTAAPRVRYCRVANCTQGAASATGGRLDPHGYGAAGIFCEMGGSVENCEVIDCVYPIFMHYPDTATRVVGNTIWCATNRTNCNQGISFVRYHGEVYTAIDAGSLCQGNTVRNVGYDPQGEGQNGNGIEIQHCRGIKVIGNTIRDCEGAGIHIADRAYDTTCIGNDVAFCGIDTAGGITVETSIDASLSQPSGVTIVGNTVHHNSKYGIMPSWSAGTVVEGNSVHDNGWEGIWSDCDRVSIVDNMVWDNVRLNAAPVPSSSPNVKAQIKVTAGVGNIITGNQVFHTPTATKYAAYGIAVDNNSHVITGNVLTGAGATTAIYQTGSTNNLVGNNIDGTGGNQLTVVNITQAQYDALATKNPNTVYVTT